MTSGISVPKGENWQMIGIDFGIGPTIIAEIVVWREGGCAITPVGAAKSGLSMPPDFE